MVSFLQRIYGAGIVIVTVALQLDELPQASVAVSVTVLGPMFEQSKPDLLMDKLIKLQASELPPFTSAAVIVAVSLTNSTVIFLHTAVGGVVSIIEMVWLTVSDILPQASTAHQLRVIVDVTGQLPVPVVVTESSTTLAPQPPVAVGP